MLLDRKEEGMREGHGSLGGHSGQAYAYVAVPAEKRKS